MICLSCLFAHGRNTDECKFCNSCTHLCRQKCVGLLRAKAIDKKPVVYATPKAEPLVRKFDHCRQVTCRKAFKVEHALQVYCSTPCGRKDRNRNYRESRVSGSARPSLPGPLPL